MHSQSVFLSVSQIMFCNSNSYYQLLLLLSGDISLNQGPFHNLQPLDQNEWNISKHRGLHFLHLDINSLLLKIDELRHITRLTNAAVMGTSEYVSVNVGLSAQQLIYCRRKITRIKRRVHKKITFRSFKNYTIDGYEKALVEINFPEYKKFDSVNDAYSNFIEKLVDVTDKVAPVKSKGIKKNSQEWFDSEISEKLIIRDKLFKKYKKTRLHVDKEIYKRARYSVQNLIAKQKK